MLVERFDVVLGRAGCSVELENNYVLILVDFIVRSWFRYELG